MTVPTTPAVSDALRDAVAREIFIALVAGTLECQRSDVELDWTAGRFPIDRREAYACASALLAPAGPIASEIARITGERDALMAFGMNDALIRFRKIEARAEAAEAETARLRAALEALKGAFHEDSDAHRAISAALSSQEQADV